MCTLMGLNNDFVTLICDNLACFDLFDEVYLFGSSLDDNKCPNDLDLLLIYSTYSDSVKESVKIISHSMEDLLGVPIDLTVLSMEEKVDTQFLNKLSHRYLKLK